MDFKGNFCKSLIDTRRYFDTHYNVIWMFWTSDGPWKSTLGVIIFKFQSITKNIFRKHIFHNMIMFLTLLFSCICSGDSVVVVVVVVVGVVCKSRSTLTTNFSNHLSPRTRLEIIKNRMFELNKGIFQIIACWNRLKIKLGFYSSFL